MVHLTNMGTWRGLWKDCCQLVFNKKWTGCFLACFIAHLGSVGGDSGQLGYLASHLGMISCMAVNILEVLEGRHGVTWMLWLL